MWVHPSDYKLRLMLMGFHPDRGEDLETADFSRFSGFLSVATNADAMAHPHVLYISERQSVLSDRPGLPTAAGALHF